MSIKVERISEQMAYILINLLKRTNVWDQEKNNMLGAIIHKYELPIKLQKQMLAQIVNACEGE